MSDEPHVASLPRSEPDHLDPTLRRLVSAARGLPGLSVLLLFGQDPMTCDTAQGFALRVHHPLPEVREALVSLSDVGVLQSSRHPRDVGHISYWLSEDSTLFAALRSLRDAYMADPARRRTLLRALLPQSPRSLQPS